MAAGRIAPVYYFWPNLIGYARILAAIGAFAVSTTQPWVFFVLYAVSQLLDAFDGHAARYFNQSTKYGAVLDMVTDRASTACLWVTLSQLYPAYTWAFQAMLALDILSHFARLFATMSGGSKSHKDVDETSNIFLKYYYGNRIVLFTLCAGHEGAFLLLYLWNMFAKMGGDVNGVVGQIVLYALYFNIPLCILKEWMNAVQFWQSMVDIVALDMQERRRLGLEPAEAGETTTAKPAAATKSPKTTKNPVSPKSSSQRKKNAD